MLNYSRVDGVSRDEQRAKRLMRSYARLQGSMAPVPTIVEDLKTNELLFETLCVRDLRVFAEALDGKVYHYRDKSGLECDTVVHLRNGSYGLIEIKLGGEKLIQEGVDALTDLADKIDTTKMKKPSFMMVLTAVGQYAYKRPKDGVLVVPIGCLKD